MRSLGKLARIGRPGKAQNAAPVLAGDRFRSLNTQATSRVIVVCSPVNNRPDQR